MAIDRDALGRDAFFQAYIECALWSSKEYDSKGDMLDSLEGKTIEPKSLEAMREECDAFIDEVAPLLERVLSATYSLEMAGHDFWLTRNRHGAGFWDRGLGEIGGRLTQACRHYGSCDLVVNDDGSVSAL